MNNYSNQFNPLYIISQIIVTVMESLRANQQISGVKTKYQIEVAELENRIRELENRIKLAQRDQDKLVAKHKSKIGQLQFNTNLKGSALLLVIAGIVILHIFGGNKQRQEQKLQNEQKQEQYTQLENDLKANQNQIADLKSQLDAAQQQKQQLESKLETAQQATQKQAQDLESKLETAQQAAQKQVQDLESKLETAQQVAQKQAQDLESKLETAQETAQKQAQDLESKLETAQETAQKQLQDLKSELDNEQSQRAQLETELKTATNQSVIVNGSKDANTIELATSFGEYKASLNTLKDTLKERLAASDFNIEKLKKKIDDIQNTSELLSNTKNQIKELNDELVKTKKDVEEMKNRIIESLNQQNKIDELQNKIKEIEKTGEKLETEMKLLIEIYKKSSSKNNSKNTSKNTSKAIDNSNQASIESTSRSKHNIETTLAPEACNLGQKDNTMRDNDDDTGGDSGGSSGSGKKRESVGSSKNISQIKEEEKKENNTGDSTSGNQQGQPVKTSLTIAIPIFIPQNSISIGTNYTNSLESVPLKEPISLETNLGLKNPVPLSANRLPPLMVKKPSLSKTQIYSLEEKYVVVEDPNRIRVVNNQLIKGSNSDNEAIKGFNGNGKQSNDGDSIPVYRPENASLNNKPIVNGENGKPLDNETGSNDNVKLDNGTVRDDVLIIHECNNSGLQNDDPLTTHQVDQSNIDKNNQIYNKKYLDNWENDSKNFLNKNISKYKESNNSYLENKEIYNYNLIKKNSNLINPKITKPQLNEVDVKNPYGFKLEKPPVMVEQDVVFSTLTPTIELVEFCVLNTNNATYVGLFVPALGCMYIFEYAFLLALNLVILSLMTSSIKELVNNTSMLILNKDIKNEINFITQKAFSVILIYFIASSLCYGNIPLFLKTSSICFTKNLINGNIQLNKYYATKHMDIEL